MGGVQTLLDNFFVHFCLQYVRMLLRMRLPHIGRLIYIVRLPYLVRLFHIVRLPIIVRLLYLVRLVPLTLLKVPQAMRLAHKRH